jgi:Common central domain of tyrosinase/Polyphenol oxidase middle domain
VSNGIDAYVRRDVYSLDPDGPEVQALRTGIAAMQARPVTDPTSWLFQANIHGTNDQPPAEVADAARATWSSCQHGTFFFLSWHRMYLYHFERILRAASGDPEFALPYWNYSVPTQRALPAIFREPADASNPLFITQRRTSDPDVNAGEEVPAAVTDASNAFSFTNFASPTGSGLSFGGQIVRAPRHFSSPHGRLEMQPHDIIHVVMGGSGWMSDPNFAARDPIFWLHHCNIDRLWNRWLSLGGGRANPTDDAVWMDQPFAFFDETGSMVQMSGRGVVESAELLGYRYDDEPLATPRVFVAASMIEEVTEASMAGAEENSPAEAGGVAVTLGPETTTITVPAEGAPAALAPETARAGSIVLDLSDIEYELPPMVWYEVYINLPEKETPSPRSPYFAGNLAFFAVAPHHHREEGQMGQVDMEISGVLDRQARQGMQTAGEVKVTFVARGAGERGASERPVRIGRVRLARR